MDRSAYLIAPIPISGAVARRSASSSSAASGIGSPDRLRNILPSGPRTAPKATCSAVTPSGSQPAARATAKTIWKWIRCGVPTT